MHYFLVAWRNGWQIISPKKSFSVFAASSTEKNEWVAHMKKCITDIQAKKSMFHLMLLPNNLNVMLITVIVFTSEYTFSIHLWFDYHLNNQVYTHKPN